MIKQAALLAPMTHLQAAYKSFNKAIMEAYTFRRYSNPCPLGRNLFCKQI